MRIIESDFDGLVERMGASRRLASRIGALARAGLYVTETLVEIAISSDGGPLQALLLSKEMLDSGAALDSRSLKRRTADPWFAENPLALVKQGDRRVLCLAEEADDASEPTPDSANAMTAAAPNTILAPGETRKLLSAEELPKLKLDLVTSSEPGRRLEAVRKLFLSGLEPDQKTPLFLAALTDRDSEVRAEAARALGALGLDSGLTENLATASGGSTAERVVAVANLGRLIPRLDEAQQALGVGAMLEFVKPSEEREIVLAVLGLLSARVGALAQVSALAPRLHGQLISLLQVHFSKYEDAARPVYTALFNADKTLTSSLLARAVEEVAQENLRFFALSLITQNDMAAAGNPAVVAQFVNGLCTGSELDRNHQACGAALARLGDVAVNGLLQRLPGADDTGRRRIIDLFGHMLRGSEGVKPVSKDAALRAAEACVDLYPAANGEIRTAVLESGVFNHTAVTNAVKLRAVRAFVDSLHEFRFERQIELVQLALTQCGRVALAPLHEAMLHSGHDVTRLSSALLLPRIIEVNPAVPAKELGALVKDIRALVDAEESDFPDRGPLFVALGRIGAHPNFPAKDADALAGHLREIVGRSSAVYDVFEALGYIAAGENLSSTERLEVGYLLLGVLKKGVPSPSVRTKKNAEGEEVLHFGRETTAYTDMIPRILEGLGRMLQAKRTPDVLFESIARELVTIWAEITDYKRIWAPAATMTLANLLGQIALGTRRADTMVDEIGELLSRRLVLLPVLQVISQIAASRPKGERMDKLSARIFTELQKRLDAEPPPEFTERRQLLQTMTALVQRPKLGEREKDADGARRVVVEALFDAMRDKALVARSLLDSLAACTNVSESLRADIKRRLKPAIKTA